ncbi:Hypothetical protein PHPALM_3074 [Phytophthora palmivora]|uniref:Uncharacterized protein n=1 Tax=Phytophthora palmivora TaxID=4796 RepID=A0A2P4YN97_9STRA|nr:Hypothetical protein PHPALM_3074 [Phytophthora palmivora]
MMETIQEFDAALAMDFRVWVNFSAPTDSAEPFELPRVHLIPNQLMIGKVSALLPVHLWGPSVAFTPEEFTLEKVEK